jgi:hypothetical protein
MNRGLLIQRVARKTSLDGTSGSEDYNLIAALLNEAVVEVSLRTHIYVQLVDVALVAGTAEYRLDSSILAIDNQRGTTPAGQGTPEIISTAEMIARQSTNVQNAGWRRALSFEGNLLTVSPTPDTGESLRFWATLKPSPMTDDSNDPSTPAYGGIPEPHRCLEYYCLWQLAEDVEKTVPIGPVQYLQQFQQECSLMSKRKHKIGGRQLAPASIGYPTSRRVPTRNDVYPAQRR